MIPHSDGIFALLVYAAWPATLLYPLVYGTTTKWWKSWIGRALMVEALGVFVLLTFSALFQFFGPGYWGRDYVRILGMMFAVLGFWMMFIALLRVQWSVLWWRKPPFTEEPSPPESRLNA